MNKLNEVIGSYLNQSDWRVKENSNTNYSFAGLQGHLTNIDLTSWALANMYTGEISLAHEDALYHIHDISHPIVGYCAGWGSAMLIKEGFNCGPNFVYSAPPKHLDAWYGQVNNFIFTMSGEWAGAQALNSVDTYSAAFMKKDDMSDKDVYRALRQLVFNLNIKTRLAMQAPFSNWSVDITVPDDLKDERVIIGGEDQGFTYGECQPEMDRWNKIFCQVMMEGDGMNKIFGFPIITYGVTKDFPWDSDLAEAIFTFADESNSPYFNNFINSNLNPSDIRSMCCRLQLDLRELVNVGGGLFGAGDSTGSLGVVTVNLSKISYLAKMLGSKHDNIADYQKAKDILGHYPELKALVGVHMQNSDHRSDLENMRTLYFSLLRYFMDLARKSLLIKREKVLESMESGLLPYTKRYLGHLNNHFNTIGLNAGNEACLNMLGVGIETEQGKAFMEETLKFMLNKLSDYQETDEGKLLWNLEATPAEGAGTRFAKKDRKDFSGIITGGGTNLEFYTNSTQLPEDYTENIFDVFEHQDALQPMYTSGTVQHIYMNEPVHNWRVIQSLVKKLFTNYKLPYLSISPDICVCPICGKLNHTYEYCPNEHTEEEIQRLVEQGIIQE